MPGKLVSRMSKRECFTLSEKDNFVLADTFYEVHIYANYLLIVLVALHILAVIVHHFIFKDKILDKIT